MRPIIVSGQTQHPAGTTTRTYWPTHQIKAETDTKCWHTQMPEQIQTQAKFLEYRLIESANLWSELNSSPLRKKLG